jgi:hypothetical protein
LFLFFWFCMSLCSSTCSSNCISKFDPPNILLDFIHFEYKKEKGCFVLVFGDFGESVALMRGWCVVSWRISSPHVGRHFITVPSCVRCRLRSTRLPPLLTDVTTYIVSQGFWA